jgi:hypothetical protein
VLQVPSSALQNIQLRRQIGQPAQQRSIERRHTDGKLIFKYFSACRCFNGPQILADHKRGLEAAVAAGRINASTISQRPGMEWAQSSDNDAFSTVMQWLYHRLPRAAGT